MNYLLTNEETERLTMRLLEEGDFNEWMELFEEESTSLFLGFGQGQTRQQLCEKWFEKCFARYE